MAWIRAFIALSAIVLTTGEARAAPCDDMAAPIRPQLGSPPRPITYRDLLELRDIGDPNSAMSGAPARLTVSPDGRRVAFALVRADLTSNGYCHAIYIADIAPGTRPRLVSAGGEHRAELAQVRGYYANNGSMRATIPLWSPDGRYLAFLRADGGISQAWVAHTDGTGSWPVTRTPGDVTAIAWSQGTGQLVFATSPTAAAEQAAIGREAETGWLYDARVFTSFALRPLIAVTQRYVVQAVDPDTREIRSATAAEAKAIPDDYGMGYPGLPEAVAGDGRRAWGERSGEAARAPVALRTSDRAGVRHDCDADWCRSGIYGLWWDPHSPALYVQRREGWHNEVTAFYRWLPGEGTPRRILATTDVVQDCGWAIDGFVCTRENATTPRHIVRIDRQSGRSVRVFDPNPAFGAIALGSVRRLRARNVFGLESWGDLVLPPDYKRGRKLPLVVVQYRSQGFLRGGVGDEYPIYPLVRRGFAVLSIERPAFYAHAFQRLATADDNNAASFKGWVERWNALSALEVVLDQAIATGTIDAQRIGLTGLSDGASTARFAMLNSRRFAAVAISGCCFDPNSVMSASGPAFADYLRKMGFPPTIRPDPGFWKDYSLAVSGARTTAPLLMQLSDHEAGSALETIQAMREYGKPVETFVFPNEYHVKWQPRHKQAVGERSIDWFAYWLQDRADPEPAKAAQYRRWEALRTLRDTPASTPKSDP